MLWRGEWVWLRQVDGMRFASRSVCVCLQFYSAQVNADSNCIWDSCERNVTSARTRQYMGGNKNGEKKCIGKRNRHTNDDIVTRDRVHDTMFDFELLFGAFFLWFFFRIIQAKRSKDFRENHFHLCLHSLFLARHYRIRMSFWQFCILFIVRGG